MAFPIDLTQWRVYSAEQSLPVGDEFQSLEEASTYMWWVQSTKWWRTQFPDAPRITVRVGGDANAVGEVQSHARLVTPDHWEVSLHPQMMNALVLLHEVAHCLAPRKYGDLKQIKRERLVFGDHHHHGEYFRAAFAALTERYRIGVDPHELRRAYAHFELDTPGIDALMEAREHSVAVEQAVAEMWRRHEDRWENDAELVARRQLARVADEKHLKDIEEVGAVPRVLGESWGDWIWLSRRHARPRVSQKRLADAVSPAVRCTARDVARIERMGTAPDKQVDLLRCVAFVAVLGLDPVWAETHKGLGAGENTLTLDILASIAPEWVADVRHLNALLEARPPRWRADGDR